MFILESECSRFNCVIKSFQIEEEPEDEDTVDDNKAEEVGDDDDDDSATDDKVGLILHSLSAVIDSQPSRVMIPVLYIS